MTETNKLIIKMIEEGASVNKIAQVTGLSNKQLFYRLNLLKAKGFTFTRKYYENGDITYNIIKSINPIKNISTTILTDRNSNSFKALFISDIHLGSLYDCVKYLDMVYDYCINNNIYTIINAGDFIDGTIGNIKKIEDIDTQINYAIKNYPFDKNILNFLCLGNHDYSALEKYGQDFGKTLNARRHDIVPIGYGTGVINLKNDYIVIRHPETPNSVTTDLNKRFIFYGHSHKMKVLTSHFNNVLNIPSLCNLPMSKHTIPGALLAELKFNNGEITNGLFTQLIIMNNELCPINEMNLYLKGGNGDANAIINNIDDRKYTNTLSNKKVLSQIDKFNKRYHR